VDKSVKSTSEKVTLKIPRPLYAKIGRAIAGAGYNSVTAFGVYVLRDLMASHETPHQPNNNHDDIEHVKDHLRALGYLGGDNYEQSK